MKAILWHCAGCIRGAQCSCACVPCQAAKLREKRAAAKAELTEVNAGARLWARALGSTIRSLRIERGLDLRALATEAGIKLGFLSQVERALYQPSIGLLQRIAAALGVTMRELLPEIGREQEMLVAHARQALQRAEAAVVPRAPHLDRLRANVEKARAKLASVES